MRNKRDELKSYENINLLFKTESFRLYLQVSKHPAKESLVYLPTNLCMLDD